MLVIRNQQMEVLKKISEDHFAEDMMSHVKTYFPNHYQIAGETAVRQTISLGIRRAQIHGFESERDLSIYITTMMLIGSNFDTDRIYPWASLVLQGNYASPAAKANELADKTLDFYSKTAGKENRYINRALLTLHNDLEEFVQKAPSHNFSEYVKGGLSRFYPQKYEVLGDSIIEILIDEGIKTTERYNIFKNQGTAILSAMMLFLGSSVVNDPMVPWVQEILLDDTTSDQETKTKTLFDSSYDYLGKWLGKSGSVSGNTHNV